jgi:hypothetical protein
MIMLGLSFVANLSSVVSLVFMVIHIDAFAPGLGPVFWVLIGEIFPSSARAEDHRVYGIQRPGGLRAAGFRLVRGRGDREAARAAVETGVGPTALMH